MKWLLTVGGLILLALGVVWSLQGSGAMAGSVMSGKSQFLYIGLVVGVVGLVALVSGVLRLARRRPQ